MPPQAENLKIPHENANFIKNEFMRGEVKTFFSNQRQAKSCETDPLNCQPYPCSERGHSLRPTERAVSRGWYQPPG
jgi:hypothetical protein